jgi:hypothetical protein
MKMNTHLSLASLSATILLVLIVHVCGIDAQPAEAQQQNPATTNSRVAGQSAAEVFKTVVDAKTGRYASANEVRDTVILRENNGTVVWSTNVVMSLPKQPEPRSTKINSIRMHKGQLFVTVGKAFARIDTKTGAVKWLGSD